MTIEKFPLRVKEKLQLCWQWNARSCAFWFLIFGGCGIYAHHKFSNFWHIRIRSGFKTSDQVQGQGARPIGKAQHTLGM
jgi:hypothetical protein